jgi:hypothetical protein
MKGNRVPPVKSPMKNVAGKVPTTKPVPISPRRVDDRLQDEVRTLLVHLVEKKKKKEKEKIKKKTLNLLIKRMNRIVIMIR